MEDDLYKTTRMIKETASTGKKKLLLPFKIKITPPKSALSSTKSAKKMPMPIPIRILDKMYPDEKPKVRRQLIVNSPKKNKPTSLSCVQKVPEIKSGKKSIYSYRQSTINNNCQPRQSIKPATTPKDFTARKSYLPKSENKIIKTPKFVTESENSSNDPNNLCKAEKKVKKSHKPSYPPDKLNSLKFVLQESIKSMTAALEIVNELSESSKGKSEKLSTISQGIQTSFKEIKEIVEADKVISNTELMDTNKENNENITTLKKEPINIEKPMTPKRRSLRLANKLQKSDSTSSLNKLSIKTGKLGSGYEDSFLKMEHELNIVHDKKTQSRKTIGGSLRELAILQSSNSAINTPKTCKLVRSKSILNTPRTVTSKSAMKQLQSLLSESPFHH